MNREPLANHWVKLGVLAVGAVAAAGAVLWWWKIHDFSVQQSIDAGIEVLRAAGPWVFFTAFALLPAVGFPIAVFYLVAGSVFLERLGLGGVLAASGAALLVNISLSYWLARFALRPWLEQLISRTKYKIPVVAPGEQAEITVLLRVTPGPPFFIQSYLLGLAEIRFTTYLGISWAIAMTYATGLIVFGDAILHGKGRVAFLGFSAVVAVGLIVHLLRKHYGKKRA